MKVVLDSAARITKAIGKYFPRSSRQHCFIPRMRNLSGKVPDDLWPNLKSRGASANQAPSCAMARHGTDGLFKDCDAGRPCAVAYFQDDFESFIAPPQLPPTHRRRTHTPNLFERLFREKSRRPKFISNAFGGKAELKLMFSAMIRVAERWHAVKITEFEPRRRRPRKAEFDQECVAQTGFRPNTREGRYGQKHATVFSLDGPQHRQVERHR